MYIWITRKGEYVINIRIASENDKEKWNQFVDRERGSFFQYYDWKYIYESRKQHFIPLLIQDNNSDITAIFPFVEQKDLIYPYLISLHEGATGGFLLSDFLNEDEKNLHLKLFFEFIDKNYSHSHSLFTLKEQIKIENGSIEPSQILLENGYKWLKNTTKKFRCTHYLKLEMPFEEKIWDGLWSKKLRRNVRHVRKTGFHVVIDDKLEYLDDFVEMQIQMVKKFDVVLDKDNLYQIFKVFHNKSKLFIGLVDSQPISAQFCYFTPTTLYLSKGPYLPAAREYRNSELPTCAAIKYACESGFRYVEFGITSTPDLALYKEKFGATSVPMRTYTKNFSHFKVITNKTYQYLTWGEKKLGELR